MPDANLCMTRSRMLGPHHSIAGMGLNERSSDTVDGGAQEMALAIIRPLLTLPVAQMPMPGRTFERRRLPWGCQSKVSSCWRVSSAR